MAITTATSADLPVAGATPPTVPTDAQGYVNSPARCAPNQTAVAVGRTPLSLVAICTDGRGYYEYRGMRLSDRAMMILPAEALSNGCFGAHSDAVSYTVSERKLLLTTGMRVLRDEPMLEFKDYRTPSEAPITKTAAQIR
jgi:hypothetical protein